MDSVETSSLDRLLERYLMLLDQYETLRKQSSGHFSSGFLSLAQANYASPHRFRYGQDYYDGRMQAVTRLVVIPPPAPSSSSESVALESSSLRAMPKVAIDPEVPWPTHPPRTPLSANDAAIAKAESELSEKEKSALDEKTQDGAKPQSRGSADDDFDEKKAGRESSPSNPPREEQPSSSVPSPPLPPKDPILQFGVLVPPALRSAQTSFRKGLDYGVVPLIGVLLEMQEVERLVQHARTASTTAGPE